MKKLLQQSAPCYFELLQELRDLGNNLTKLSLRSIKYSTLNLGLISLPLRIMTSKTDSKATSLIEQVRKHSTLVRKASDTARWII